MSTSSSRNPILPEAWEQVVARAQGLVGENMDSLSRRQEALDAKEKESEPNLAGVRQEELGQLADRFKGLDARLQDAMVANTEADLALAGSSTMVRDYLAGMAALRQKLADWHARAIV